MLPRARGLAGEDGKAEFIRLRHGWRLARGWRGGGRMGPWAVTMVGKDKSKKGSEERSGVVRQRGEVAEEDKARVAVATGTEERESQPGSPRGACPAGF